MPAAKAVTLASTLMQLKLVLRDLKKAELKGHILSFKCSQDSQELARNRRGLGVDTYDVENCAVRILILDEYVDLWLRIRACFLGGGMASPISMILGTAGNGKNMFCWYLVSKWILEDQDISEFKFEDVQS